MPKSNFFFPLFILAICFGCKKDKTYFADVYVSFDYAGPKIDSTTSAADQLVFRNIDGSPTVYIPNTNQLVCQDKIKVGTYALGDTIQWHLRLVEPDGDPQSFKILINKKREIILINTALHFVLPNPYDFTASVLHCDDQAIIRIGN